MRKRVFEKWISVIMTFAMVVSLVGVVPAFAVEQGAPVYFADGDGSSANPYQIANAEQLALLATVINGAKDATVISGGAEQKYADLQKAYYKLTDNIVFNTWADSNNNKIVDNDELSNPNGGSPIVWTAIGIASNAFQGNFDGAGHTISGIFSNTSEYQGLFGYVSNGIVSNTGVTNSYLSGVRVGGIVGWNAGGTVSYCYYAGSISGTQLCGGVVGINASSGKVQYCYNTGNISSDHHAGGVVDYNYSGTVSYCFNTGAISGKSESGDDYLGGVVAYNYGSAAVSYSYNSGSITTNNDNSKTGGVVGYNQIPPGDVSYCYNSGSLVCSKMGKNFGGVVGVNGGTVSGCYYDKQMFPCENGKGFDVSTQSGNSVGAEGNITTCMLSKAGFSGAGWTDTNWSFIPELYPSIAYPLGATFSMDTAAAAYVSASPITLSSTDGNTYETVKAISSDFTVSTLNGVNWTSSNTDLISLSAGKATVKGYGTVTLTAACGSTSKQVLLTKPDPNPSATNVTVSGTAKVGETLTGSYQFLADSDGNKENGTKLKWYTAKDSNGKDKAEITGAESSTYKITASCEGLYIAFEVTPSDGTDIGTPVMSTWVGPVKSASYTATPSVSNASVSGRAQVSETLAASYQFLADSDGNKESGTKFKWYTAKDSSGKDKAEITGAESSTYKITDSCEGLYIAFEVTPSDGADTGTPVMSTWIGPVTKVSANTHSGSAGSDYSPSSNNSNVLVNGESKAVGNSKTTTENGKAKTTVTIDTDKLENILKSEGKGATVTISAPTSSDATAGVLNGNIVKAMEGKEAKLVIKTNSAAYTLPASEINIDSVSKQLGENVTLSDIKVTVSISKPSSSMTQVVENAAHDGGYTIAVPAVDYTITCEHGGNTVNVSRFNSYVERTIAIPDGVDPEKITTGIVVMQDGTTHHVPTQLVKINGKYYAKINSLTNSTYSVIWNPLVFSDVTEHWAKDSINNMGSRMVVRGLGNNNYAPNRSMTRAEFATIIIRALGLEPGSGASSFHDVVSTDWCSGYIETAASYGITTGYNNGNFGPNDTVTREQAMAMVARAMKITGLNATVNDSEIEKLINTYSDSSSVSAYAKESVSTCLKTGVTSGTSSTTISPKADITRAEVAVMVERLLQKSGLI